MGFISLSRILMCVKYNWLQIILIILAIYDLRIDIRILIDFFTFSTLIYTVFEHPLAIMVLITSNTLIKTKMNNRS